MANDTYKQDLIDSLKGFKDEPKRVCLSRTPAIIASYINALHYDPVRHKGRIDELHKRFMPVGWYDATDESGIETYITPLPNLLNLDPDSPQIKELLIEIRLFNHRRKHLLGDTPSGFPFKKKG